MKILNLDRIDSELQVYFDIYLLKNYLFVLVFDDSEIILVIGIDLDSDDKPINAFFNSG